MIKPIVLFFLLLSLLFNLEAYGQYKNTVVKDYGVFTEAIYTNLPPDNEVVNYQLNFHGALGLSFEWLKQKKNKKRGLIMDLGFSSLVYSSSLVKNIVGVEPKTRIVENRVYLGLGYINRISISTSQNIFYTLKYRPAYDFKNKSFGHNITASLGFSLFGKKQNLQNKCLSVEFFGLLPVPLSTQFGVKYSEWSAGLRLSYSLFLKK